MSFHETDLNRLKHDSILYSVFHQNMKLANVIMFSDFNDKNQLFSVSVVLILGKGNCTKSFIKKKGSNMRQRIRREVQHYHFQCLAQILQSSIGVHIFT